MSDSQSSRLAADLKTVARDLGFELVGIAPAVAPDGFQPFQKWLNDGYAGEMAYLPNREAAYEHPRHVLEAVRSVVMLAINYNTNSPVPNEREYDRPDPETDSGRIIPGRVSRYAQGERDYHDVIAEKLRRLADVLHAARPGCRTRGVVDTAPLLERDFGRLAGLGWFGKNTMLINTRQGSWLFLAALLTDVALEADEPHATDHCGTCVRCLEACPTDAFPEAYVLDARRCISYLNIELRGPIPADLRDDVGDWLFGCDVCQDVCPWNHKAPPSAEPAFRPVDDLSPADAAALLRLDDASFRARFRHTPLWRPKRAGLLRNAAIVLGNSGRLDAVPTLIEALSDDAWPVRGAAAWALGKLGGAEATAALKSALCNEAGEDVRQEIRSALAR
ncbi:MAG: tRNA epoxyqueuosine(34) reductase QueG [Planctomycetaceae bacterium]